MMANRILAHVFLQPSLHQVDETQMEKLLLEHPYFSAARLLLAKKVYQQTGDLQNSAIKQALLYTNQPHYAYHLIMEEPILLEVEERVAPIIPEDELPSDDSLSFAEAEIPIQHAEEKTVFSEADLSELSLEETLPEEEDLPEAVLEENTEETVIPVQELPEAILEESREETVIPVQELPEAVLEESREETVIPVQELPEAVLEENREETVIPVQELPEAILEESREETVTPVQELPEAILEESREETVTPVQELPEAVLEENREETVTPVQELLEEEQQPSIQEESKLQVQELPEIHKETISISVTHPSEVVLPVFLASSWKPTEIKKEENEDLTDAAKVAETLNDLNTEVHTITAQDNDSLDAETPQKGTFKIFPFERPKIEETELIFQPLYTDDYFAYKRLKNPDEADELNTKGAAEMKSFTSWLRRMKEDFATKSSKDWYQQQLNKIYEEDETPEISETVEKMAVNSLTFNNDIVSETLAEIWVKQKQYDNAIKIYQKLSLLNPNKNAYFAQKILELKTLTDKNK